MGREAMQVILDKAASNPSFTRQIFHNPAAALGRYDLSLQEKQALLSGSPLAIEECCGKALSPFLVNLLEKYRWGGSWELKQAFMTEAETETATGLELEAAITEALSSKVIQWQEEVLSSLKTLPRLINQ